jgi:type I restriction enzyme, R subunit
MPNFISEDQIEQALLQRLEQVHKFEILRCHCKDPEDLNDNSGRTNKRDVILVDRVRDAAGALNKHLPHSAIDEALERFADRRTAMSQVAANREIYDLIRDGVAVEFDDEKARDKKIAFD